MIKHIFIDISFENHGAEKLIVENGQVSVGKCLYLSPAGGCKSSRLAV